MVVVSGEGVRGIERGMTNRLTKRRRNKAAQKMRVVDLFSGIGGFTVSLRGIATTVAYCENDPHSRAVLKKKMEDGLIHRAPLFPDVRELGAKQLAPFRPDMIVGGFPCQDISSSGHHAGLDGSRSNLFFEIVRLLRNLPCVKHVLLENSPFIRTMGLPRVVEALHALGFVHLVYGYFHASDVGALHRRTRWVCLASKSPCDLRLNTPGQHRRLMTYPWKPEPVPRIIDKYEPDQHPPPGATERPLGAQDRCSLLGNSVVPQFITHSYHELAKALRRSSSRDDPRAACFTRTEDVGERGVIYMAHKCRRKESRPPLNPSNSSNSSAAQEKRYLTESPTYVLTKMPYATYARNTQDIRMVDRHGNVFKRMDRWYTPVHSRSAWFHVLGKSSQGRWMNNTANNIYYEKDTHAVAKRHTINPEFIEHLMGYPIGWTYAMLPLGR